MAKMIIPKQTNTRPFVERVNDNNHILVGSLGQLHSI